MKIKTVLPGAMLSVAIIAGSCNSSEVDRLKAENDSLRHELETRYSVVMAMGEIKTLIDTIDASRNALHINLREGTSYDDVTSRLVNINDYVKRTESKLSSIENELKESKGNAEAYSMMVAALKDELSIRASEIEELETQIVSYKKENKGLAKTVRLQQTELTEMRTELTAKKQELHLIEAKVDELVDNFKVSEAEAYYARGLAVEEAAKRTKLAPTKKKQTYQEALDLYKQALALGKADAQKKIDELTKKINQR